MKSFPLGKSVVYELMELPPAKIEGLGGDGAAPQPASPPGKLTGATREARAEELLAMLCDVRDLVDDVDDAPGTLPSEFKLEAMQVSQQIWREVTRLPAYAVLPQATPGMTSAALPGLKVRKP